MSLVTRCDKCKREQDNVSSLDAEQFARMGKFRIAYIPEGFPAEHGGATVDLCVNCYKKVRELFRTWLKEEKA